MPDAEAVLGELRRLRGELLARAAPRGFTLYAAGSHALARGADQPLVPLERYRKLAELLGDGDRPPAGLRACTSMSSLPDWETCLRAFEGVVPWLPTLLALSANSPFAEGERTGRRSERAVRLLDLPTGGTPPVLRERCRLGGRDRRRPTAGATGTPGRGPEYGTLEVRVMDMQTDVRRSAGLAELVGALVAAVAEGEHPTVRPRPLHAAAGAGYARGGRRGERSRRWRQLVEVGPLGAAVLAGRPEAERQLEVLPLGIERSRRTSSRGR